jgi:hypothetical protein
MARFLFAPLTPPIITTSANNALSLTLSATTIVYLTCTNNPTTIISLAATGGNVDGMVVCFSNINATGIGFSFSHESLVEPTAVNRFRIQSASSVAVAQYGAFWVRWSAISQRWQSLAKV